MFITSYADQIFHQTVGSFKSRARLWELISMVGRAEKWWGL